MSYISILLHAFIVSISAMQIYTFFLIQHFFSPENQSKQLRVCHQKASERRNLNNTAQAQRSAVAKPHKQPASRREATSQSHTIHKKASERRNLNNTVQAQRSAVTKLLKQPASRRDATSATAATSSILNHKKHPPRLPSLATLFFQSLSPKKYIYQKKFVSLHFA